MSNLLVNETGVCDVVEILTRSSDDLPHVWHTSLSRDADALHLGSGAYNLR